MSSPLVSLPYADGYHMPAEWERHAGTWLLFPERLDNWRAAAAPAQAAFARVAAAIAQFEPVTVGAHAHLLATARAALPPHIRVVAIESDDAWVRDTGPTFVTNGHDIRGVDWLFNAWGGLNGGLYADWARDDAVAASICALAGVSRYRAGFVLEGGAIHTDGEGTLLTTRECLLNPNRNPHLTQADIETRLRDYLGITHVIWLDDGVYLDETDGHIDNLACFVRPGEVALTWTDDEHDPQYAISRAAYDVLLAARDAQGRRLTVHKIHQPDPLYVTAAEAAGVVSHSGSQPRRAGSRMAASYVNFYICNGGVVMPTFDSPYDAAAVATLRALFPSRTVVPVPGREILLGGGNIHCITQQQPA